MNYNDAERVRSMIQGHWNLRMDDATCDLWLGALLDKDADNSVNAVARLAKTIHHPPKISDFEEVYSMLVDHAPLPATEICSTCGGDLSVLVGLRPTVRTQWMEDHGLDVPASGNMIEEYAPCPDCNSDCNTSFPRHNGSVFNSPDPGLVRERMAPAVTQPIPKGEQKLPGDVKTYLRDMRGISIELEQAEPGDCEQCGRDGERYEYGSLKLCEHCCSQRQKITKNLAVDDVVTLLRDVQ